LDTNITRLMNFNFKLISIFFQEKLVLLKSFGNALIKIMKIIKIPTIA